MLLEQYRRQIMKPVFFDRNPIEVAKETIGLILVRIIGDIVLSGKIVETEAYLPFNDPAAHNYKGKTVRTKSLYKSAGHAYIHSMRQYSLLDIVTEGIDNPGSVLIRAIEPIDGIETMMLNRNTDKLYNLCSGPGKLCQALKITKEIDGIDLTSQSSELFIIKLDNQADIEIEASPRIGISKAKEELLRFNVKGSPFVS